MLRPEALEAPARPEPGETEGQAQPLGAAATAARLPASRENVPRDPATPGLDELGRRIRKQRLGLQMTLKRLSGTCGLSATHLSEIERGHTSPTIGALVRIARALGRDPSFFLEPEERADVAHLSRPQCRRLASDPGATIEELTPGIPGSRISAYRLGLDSSPPGEIGLRALETPEESLYLVTRGTLEVAIGAERLVLAVGDAAHAPNAFPHAIRAASGEGGEAIAILSRPLELALRTGDPPREDARHEPVLERVRGEMLAPSAGPSCDPVDPTPAEFGRRIKMIRISRGLTLKNVERRGGISATHVSEIERGRASPTVGALGRIARALGVRPATLIEPRVLPHVAVTRAHERETRRILWGTAEVDPVSGAVDGASVGAQILMLPFGPGPALTHRHEGEEWVTVLSGVAEIRIEEQAHLLCEGDSLHFRADHPHAYSNAASGPAVLLTASRPRLSI